MSAPTHILSHLALLCQHLASALGNQIVQSIVQCGLTWAVGG